MMKPGIYHDIPAAEYHALPHISRSELVDYIENKARWYKKYVLGMFKDEETDAMQMGTDLHACILEGFKPEERFNIPLYSKELTTGAKKGQLTQAASESRAMLEGMTASVNADPRWKKWAVGGKSEVTVIIEVQGQLVKCRFDYLAKAYGIDLKTTSKPLKKFSEAMFYYRLDWQAAMYSMIAEYAGHPIKEFFFFVVEKKFPYDCAMYKLPEERYKSSRQVVKHYLDKLIMDKVGQNYDCPVEYCDYPAWAKEE